jgi:hypothetical protein
MGLSGWAAPSCRIQSFTEPTRFQEWCAEKSGAEVK